MDDNDFFILRNSFEVSQLVMKPDLDQTIRDILKEEGVKHSPSDRTRVRAKTITNGGSRQQHSKPSYFGQNIAVTSSSQGAVTGVGKVHSGGKHVTNADRPKTLENLFKKPVSASEMPPVPLCSEITAISNSKEVDLAVSEIESIIQDIVAAKSVAFTVNKDATKLQVIEIAKSMKQSDTMNAVIAQGPSHSVNLDRKCFLANSIIKYFEKNIAEIVRFAKRIQGFNDLPTDDQANLIRGARIECDIISGIMIDPDSMISMSEDGEVFTPEEITTLFSIDSLKVHSEMSRKIDQMQMSKEEVAILKALTVISPDRCNLSETSKVLNIQETLLRCLRYQVSKSYKVPAVRLGQLFALLTSLRSITELGTKEMKKMFVVFPSMTKGSVTEEIMDD